MIKSLIDHHIIHLEIQMYTPCTYSNRNIMKYDNEKFFGAML